jgi:hypothetical protein
MLALENGGNPGALLRRKPYAVSGISSCRSNDSIPFGPIRGRSGCDRGVDIGGAIVVGSGPVGLNFKGCRAELTETGGAGQTNE